VATILRRLGTLGHVLSRLLDRGIPTDRRARKAASDRAAQILWMDVPDHAASICRWVGASDRRPQYAGLVNACCAAARAEANR